MLKTRIAVFVSGGGTNLQALLDAQAAGKIPSGEIVLVAASNPKASAWERMFSIFASSSVPYFWDSVRATPGMSV